MVDANSKGNVASALAKLKASRRAWQEFRLSHEITLLRYHERTPLECDYKVSAGVLAQQVGQRGLKFHKLSSNPQGIDTQEWDIEDLGFDLHHFVIDVTQDLLIATELRCVEVGKYHCLLIHVCSRTETAFDIVVGMHVHFTMEFCAGENHPKVG